MLNLTNKERFIVALKYLNLYREKSKYKVVCPFHNDANASLLIDVENQRFFCFGCNKSGSTFELLKFAFPNESIFAIYNNIYNIYNTISGIKKEIILNNKPKIKNINKARDYYYNLPKTNWYKLNDEEELQVKHYLNNRGFKNHTLVSIGAKLTYNKNYQVIFPMLDNGIFRGYVCRTITKEIEQTRKYLYNEGFSRATTLVGNYNSDTVIVVEGFMDLLKAKQFGIQNIVAILGWKASDKQIKKLQNKGVKKIICALDNDDAGRKGYRYLKSLNKFQVFRLHYPSGCKDFGDVTQEIFPRIQKQIQKHGGK